LPDLPEHAMMLEHETFPTLLSRLRTGDESAATDLVRQYEPVIRRAVRVWLVDARLRRLFDSLDVCQSVFGSFFVRLSLGQYQLEKPEQLISLLVTMARNKLSDQARKQQAECRDHRRMEAGGVETRSIASSADSPSQVVAGKELLQEFRQRLTEEERHLADQRALGREWSDLASELGVGAEALRKRFGRAVNRVARELGLAEFDHE
jgi:RNA polymerase sigma-70 factor (ECF subfamily)